MSDPESEPTFTVVDRRRRGDGDPAPSVPPAPSPPAGPASEELPRPGPTGATASGAAVGGTAGRWQGEQGSQGSRAGAPRADLAAIFVMLYSDALLNLGQVPDPATGQPHRDLDQARFAIDLIAVLRQKTEGNRTAEESALLEEILATLQMAYVRASRQ